MLNISNESIKILLGIILAILAISVFAQQQVVKGHISDGQSKFQLIGATIMVWDSENHQPLKINNNILGTVTDENGDFRIKDVPIGRHSIRVSYVGYKDRVIDNVLLLVGKETVVNVALEESVIQGKEIVIVADKTQPLNEMAMISSRQFTVEETGRYAGSRNDPARMAANYAGVSGSNDARNDIIIRGNSPTGLLWKMDGLPIGNPNHFGALGTTGGPVSMLNNNVLSNSDFLTGAFPAEYGNANAGVFDLKMRKGNSDEHEYLGQIGFNGFEFGAEGPFSKKSDASYLVNYRYSTLGVFQKLGMQFGTGAAIPEYQDLSYKINLPTKKFGTFSTFGIMGKSAISFLDSEADTTKSKSKDFYGQDGFDSRSSFDSYTFGFNHHYFLNSNAFIKTGLVHTQAGNTYGLDSLGYVIKGNDTTSTIDQANINHIFEGNNSENRTTLSISFNQKFNAKNTLLVGSYLHLVGFNYYEKGWAANQGWLTRRNYKDNRLLTEVYAQWLHKFSDRFSINSGVHYQRFSLNGSQILEPRLGGKYQFGKGQSINMGFGLHGQILPLAVYTVETELRSGDLYRSNRSLKMSKSLHYVLGYENLIGRSWRIKMETYYQHLFDVPVTINPSSFSMLNYGADFGYPNTDSLVNSGTGRNYGLELTVEKFLSKGFYTLFTTSLYNSQYVGSDGIRRSTAFNNNYVINLLAGKEFQLRKNLTLVSDIRVSLAGGRHYSPIDLEESEKQGFTARDDSRAYSLQYPHYFRADVKTFLRLQGKKMTQEWGIDIQNITNHQNVFQQQYSRAQEQVTTVYQIGIFPVPQYRILF